MENIIPRAEAESRVYSAFGAGSARVRAFIQEPGGRLELLAFVWYALCDIADLRDAAESHHDSREEVDERRKAREEQQQQQAQADQAAQTAEIAKTGAEAASAAGVDASTLLGASEGG